MKVGLLFKSEVGFINANYTAGNERVFLQDLEILKNNKIPYTALCRATIYPNKYGVQSLFYPLFIKFITRKLERVRVNFFFRLFLIDLLNFVAEFWYCLLFWIRTLDCDVLIGHQTPLLAIFAPKKTIISLHNRILLPDYRILKRRYEKATFLFCSHYLANDFKQINNFQNRKFVVIYNAIDTGVFYKKKKYSMDKKLKLLYAGSWDEKKGLHLVLNAMARLEKRQQQNIELIISSNSKLWWDDFPQDKALYISLLKKKLKKARNVKPMQGVPYHLMPNLYRSCDCLVLSSVWQEPFGLVNIEAMSCGTPVLAFHVGAIPEIITPNENGFVLKKISAQQLEKKIEYIYKNRWVLESLGQKARSVVEEQFSLKIRERAFIDLIKSLGSTNNIKQ